MSTQKTISREEAVKLTMDLSGITRLHFKLCAQRLENLGIGVGQVPVFMVLVHTPKPLMQHEIAQCIHVTPATISGTLKRMERDGLVVRTADSCDARISRVSLSEKGRELSQKAFEGFSLSSFDMLEGFSGEELDQLCGFIQRMEANLTANLESEQDVR